MPTYEFRCPEGHEFEKFYRSISGAPRELACPECGKIAERLMSAGAGLVFKGSGFYITDYGKDGKKAQTSAPPSGSGKSDASKSDASGKPDTGSSTAQPAQESKPAPSPAADKPSSSGTKKSTE